MSVTNQTDLDVAADALHVVNRLSEDFADWFFQVSAELAEKRGATTVRMADVKEAARLLARRIASISGPVPGAPAPELWGLCELFNRIESRANG